MLNEPSARAGSYFRMYVVGYLFSQRVHFCVLGYGA